MLCVLLRTLTQSVFFGSAPAEMILQKQKKNTVHLLEFSGTLTRTKRPQQQDKQ